MKLEERKEIIERCIKSATLIVQSHTKIMRALDPTYNNDFTDTITDEITSHLYHILKLTAVSWPKEYNDYDSHTPFGLLFGEIKSKKVKKEFLNRVLAKEQD